MAAPTTTESANNSARNSMAEVSIGADRKDEKDIENGDLGRISTSAVGQSSGACNLLDLRSEND
jgi:hypothetical protein